MARKKKTVTFAASAVEDLQSIMDWYVEQQSVDAGQRWLEKIISSIDRLKDFPESGRIVPELSKFNLREIICPPYRIFYRLDEIRVRVIHILRSEQQLKLL